ncbi:MAG: hypothetical protein ACPGUD_11880 [Parashewanella sp.]
MCYKIHLTIVFIFLISACNDKTTEIVDDITATKIPVISNNDYFQNVKVCSDCDGNLHCDKDERFSITDLNGEINSSSVNLSCPLVAIITPNATMKNSSSQPSEPYTLTSPHGCKIISPITSLVHQKINIDRQKQTIATDELQEYMLTDLPLCHNYLNEKSNSKATAISIKEAEIYQQIAADFITNYPERVKLLRDHEKFNKLPKLAQHEFAVFSQLRNIDQYAKIPTIVRKKTAVTSMSISASSTDDTPDDTLAAEGAILVHNTKHATAFNLLDPFNSNLNTKISLFHGTDVGLKYTYFQVNSGQAIESQNFRPSAHLSETKSTVLGYDSLHTLSHSTIAELGEYSFFGPDNAAGADSIEFTNNPVSSFKYSLVAAAFDVSELHVSTVMSLFPRLSDSWGVATQGSTMTFPVNTNLYSVARIPISDTVLFKPQPQCTPRADDPIAGLCHYVDVFRPQSRTRNQQKIVTSRDKRTKSGYIYQAGNNELPDILYLGATKDGSHVVAYRVNNDFFRFSLLEGKIDKLTITDTGDENELVLKFFNDKTEINEVTATTIDWQRATINGNNIASIIVPNSFRKMLPQLPRFLALVKKGGYDRQGTYYLADRKIDRVLLGVDVPTRDFIIESIDPNSDVFKEKK